MPSFEPRWRLSGSVAIRGVELADELSASGYLLSTGRGWTSEHDQLVARLAAVDAGITAGCKAIAETGTLVINNKRQTRWLVSLLTPVHIELLRSWPNLRAAGAMRSPNCNIRGRRLIAGDHDYGTKPHQRCRVDVSIGVHGPKECRNHSRLYETPLAGPGIICNANC